MIKTLCAATREIDDPAAAAAEILAAIAPEKNLLKHSLGLIACYSEFEDTGALRAVCDALPFDCIGATTCLCAGGGQVGEVLLALTVLTSDDCRFETLSVPAAERCEEAVSAALAPLLAPGAERPALFFCAFPLINTVGGDRILSAIDAATGGIPLFGTTAVDHTPDYSTSKTFFGGRGSRDALVLAAVYGDPGAAFGVATLVEGKIRAQKAIITESDGNILIGVNGKTALAYLEEIGLTEEVIATGLGVVPFVVDHGDGTKPVARSVFGLTPEGHAVCGGSMPVGATLGIGGVTESDVIATMREALRDLTAAPGGIMSYSCIARYLVLGANPSAEAEAFADAAGPGGRLFAHSGGEICPLPTADGRLRNFFHNYTAVFCRLG